MAAMAYMAQPIQLMQWELFKGMLDDEMQDIVEVVDEYSLGLRVISPLIEFAFTKAEFLSKGMVKLMVDSERDQYGEAPYPHALLHILLRARQCATGNHSEVAWNSNVHSRILQLATLNSPYADSTDYIFISSATVEPSTLLPMDYVDHIAEKNIIDLAITLDLPDVTHQAIIHAAANEETAIDSLNQSMYAPLRYNPIAVSIKTTLPGEHWDRAQRHVAIWAAAQYNKLEGLLARVAKHLPEIEKVQLLPLPLIIIQGHDWNLLMVTRDEQRTYLWSKITFGSTDSYFGMYKIIATLQYLIHWANKTYRPWLSKNILDPLLGLKMGR